MNIVDMSKTSFDTPGLRYVGRTPSNLALGNPWSHLPGRQVRYKVKTKQEAINKYKKWLDKLLNNYLLGLGFIGLQDWERIYFRNVIRLAEAIKKNQVTCLGCWCIHVLHYNPLFVPDGGEHCHAEILYKCCLKLIESWEK